MSGGGLRERTPSKSCFLGEILIRLLVLGAQKNLGIFCTSEQGWHDSENCLAKTCLASVVRRLLARLRRTRLFFAKNYLEERGRGGGGGSGT